MSIWSSHNIYIYNICISPGKLCICFKIECRWLQCPYILCWLPNSIAKMISFEKISWVFLNLSVLNIIFLSTKRNKYTSLITSVTIGVLFRVYLLSEVYTPFSNPQKPTTLMYTVMYTPMYTVYSNVYCIGISSSGSYDSLWIHLFFPDFL